MTSSEDLIKHEIAKGAFDRMASAYEQKFMELDIYDDTYDKFCELVPANAKVLEIGCGPGNVTKYILSKRPNLRIKGIDIAPSMVRLAQQNNPSADFEVMDCKDILQLHEQYDAVICGFGMPYLSKQECEKLIADCGMLLNDKGVLYFSVIEDKYSKSGFEYSSNKQEKCYVYYHEESYLTEFLSKSGFRIVYADRKTYQKSESEISIHLIIISQKK